MHDRFSWERPGQGTGPEALAELRAHFGASNPARERPLSAAESRRAEQLRSRLVGNGPGCLTPRPTRRLRPAEVAGALGATLGLLALCAMAILTTGLLGRGSPPRPGTTLRLASYSLRLPAQFRAGTAASANCTAVLNVSVPGPGNAARAGGAASFPSSQPRVVKAVDAADGCVLMTLTPLFRPIAPGLHGDPNVPRGGREVKVGPYDAWTVPPGYWVPLPGEAKAKRADLVAGLVIRVAASRGEVQDLVIGCSEFSENYLVDLVARNLSP